VHDADPHGGVRSAREPLGVDDRPRPKLIEVEIGVAELEQAGPELVLVRIAVLLDEPRVDLHRAWSRTTHALQRLRDQAEAADQEYERLLDAADPGLAPRLTFDPTDAAAAPYIATAARPRVAILREQGVNGHVEAAAGFAMATENASSMPPVGRNEPCPCGSGKKHKNCCGRVA